MGTRAEDLQLGTYKYGWHDESTSVFEPKKGLSEDVVREISALKSEPKWMLDLRLKSLKHFERRPMPNWGGDLSHIDFSDIYYFIRSTEKQASSWEELPEEIRETYDRLGLPEAEKQRLVSGIAAQYECLAGDARVWTANRGLVPIKNIETGDQVFALDEETGSFVVAPVKGSAQTDVRQTYAVTVNGQTIRATDNHPVLTLTDARKPGRQRARYERRWKTVGELQVGDLVAVPRGLPEFGASRSLRKLYDPSGRVRVPATTSADLLWLLGYFLGDGNLESNGRTHRIQFAAHEDDVEVRAVTEQFGLEVKVGKDGQRLVVHSRLLVEWLQDLGFIGGARTKRIPDWVFTLSRNERLAFLGGWVDADGYVRPEKWGSVLLTSVNEPMLRQGAELAVLSGLRAAGPWEFSSKHPYDPERSIIGFRLGISGDFELLDCRNPRRTERFGRRKYFHSNTTAKGTTFRTHCTDHLGFARVTAIEAADVEPVYDIAVDGPHNFVAEGMVVHNSEVVYHKVREDLEAQGVLFLDTDTALQKHEDLFREHFTKVIPANDNKFAALNTAVWSGGSFIWVPEGVKVDIPLQAYFRINQQNMGQFERTLIIAEPGSYIHYVEGCLPAGELVGTADGDWRPIESIEVGEHVLTHEGRPARVTATQARDYRGQLYTFQPISPDSAFAVTEEHPLLVVRDGAEPEWVEAKGVRESDLLVFPKPRPQPAATILPLELARLAGYYLAFGSTDASDGAKTIEFVLPMDDRESLEEIRRLSKDLYDAPGAVVWDERNREAKVQVDTKSGYEALRHLGSDPDSKRLPADFFRQDEAFLRALVETYLRGHDCAVKDGAIRHRAQTASRTWAYQLQAVLARLDVFATVSDNSAYAVEWVTGGRGHRTVKDAGEHFLVPIAERTVTEFDGQVYNLDVEAPDSYLASGFAVHNCTAPIYSSDSLHSAVVEIIVKPGARVRYTTIQNWSNNVYNLVTKRAAAYEDSTMEWVDANIGCLAQGSRVTTRSGVKPIEELTPGEEVLSYDEERGELCFRTVTAKKYSGEQPVREVRVGGRRLLATDNHPFFGHGPGATAETLAYVRTDAVTHAALPDAESLRDMAQAGGSVAVIAPARLRTEKVDVSDHLATVPTWDIEVEGTGNFVAEGFIVHNSKLTMKYPAVWLMGRGAKGDVLSVAFAGDGQHQDAGAKMVHHAPDTSSNIVSKSVSQGTGRTSYRGLVDIQEGANRVKSSVVCDALLLDETARSDTYPYMSVQEDDAQIGHEASVSKVGDEQLFYLQSRGIEEAEALAMIVRGFIEPIAKELPMEYAVELNRLISLNMEGSVG
jgi:Fe-S cluster assembly scaffold protein SufB